MHTCRWYDFVLAHENVGNVIIQFAGEVISISIGLGECLTLHICSGTSDDTWESTYNGEERPRAQSHHGWFIITGSEAQSGSSSCPFSIIGSATWSLYLSPFTVGVIWSIVVRLRYVILLEK